MHDFTSSSVKTNAGKRFTLAAIVTLGLLGIVGCGGSSSGGSVNPNPGTLQFSTSSYSGNEDAGDITVTVTRIGGSNGAVTVVLNDAGTGTATSGADYIAITATTLSWDDSETATKSFTVTIINDSELESNETFTLALSSPMGATLGVPSTATLTINEKPVAVTFPSFHQTYQQGDRNRYAFIAGSNPDILAGGLELTWETSFVPLTDPFTSGPINLPLVKFSGTVTFGSGPTTAIQYITQSTDAADQGSMFLHAFDDTGSPVTDYWIEGDTPLTSLGKVQTIYSPYQVDAATLGEKGRVRNNSYKVMGNCTPSVCQEIANVIETFTVVDQPLQVITTAVGEFETYRIIYDITITPTGSASPPLSSILDFRTTCGGSDFTLPINATGEMFVNPDIGPVRIRNTCTSGPIITSYTALLSLTTLPTN